MYFTSSSISTLYCFFYQVQDSSTYIFAQQLQQFHSVESQQQNVLTSSLLQCLSVCSKPSQFDNSGVNTFVTCHASWLRNVFTGKSTIVQSTRISRREKAQNAGVVGEVSKDLLMFLFCSLLPLRCDCDSPLGSMVTTANGS